MAEVTKTLTDVLTVLPSVIKIIDHYKQMVEADNISPEDKEKAIEYLNSLRWKDFDDIEPTGGQ